MKRIILGAIAVLMIGAPVHAESLTPGQQFSLALNILARRDYGKAIQILEGMKKYEMNESQAQQVDDLLYVAVWGQAKSYELFDVPKAIDYYRKAEDLRPSDLQAASNRGFLLCKLKRFDECNSIFTKLIDVTSGKDRVKELSSWAMGTYVGGNKRNAQVIAKEGMKYAESVGEAHGPAYFGLKVVLKGP